MSDNRRHFLKRLTASSLAFAAVPSVLSATGRGSLQSQSLQFDEPLELSPLHELHALQQQEKIEFDTGWTGKLAGKYRAVFDTPSINDGSGVWRAGMWVGHYRDVLKAETSDINPVIVIRHAAIPLIMNHEFWDRYDIAKENKVRDPITDKRTKRNPVLMTVEEDKLPASFASLTLHKQIEGGAIVLGCNAAFGGMVAMVAKKEKLKFPEARARALTMVVPGVILQPNGIFGVTLAQHHGCVFVAAA